MRTLWLTWGGAPEFENKIGLSRLDYPLSYNLPRSAWTESSTTIWLKPHTGHYSLYVDLLAEVASGESLNQPGPGFTALRWCIGVGDDALMPALGDPTIRDIATLRYYSRFGDGYNVVDKPCSVPADGRLYAGDAELQMGDTRYPIQKEHFRFSKALEFIHGFATLTAGDLVSMGIGVFIPNLEKAPLELTLRSADRSLDIKIHRHS